MSTVAQVSEQRSSKSSSRESARRAASKGGAASPRNASSLKGVANPNLPATMPPPSRTRPTLAPPPDVATALNDHDFPPEPIPRAEAGSSLAGTINELGVAILATGALKDDDAGKDLFEMLFGVRNRLRAAYEAVCEDTAAERLAIADTEETIATNAAEAAGIGDFDPFPKDGELRDASVQTLLVQSLASQATDEPLAGGLDQLASEMTVLSCYLASDADLLSGEVLQQVVHGYENRIRVLAAIARRTLTAFRNTDPSTTPGRARLAVANVNRKK